MTIEELQQEIIDEFTELDDWMDRYQLLIELGETQPPLPAAETDKVADDAGEPSANKARDFGSLLAGKVAGGKKKRKRILGFNIYSAGGGKPLDSGS